MRPGLPQDMRVLLIQSSLVVSAISTLIQVYPIGGKKWPIRLGAGLPVILGISFAYLPSMQAIVESTGSIGAIAGAMIAGGIVAIIVGLMVDKIRKFFPPVITGTVVFTIGLSLYPTAVNYMAGGTANTYELVVETKGLSEALVYGSWQNWLVAAITLAAVMVLNNKGKGIFKLASILIGMAFGYIVAAFFGMVDFSDVSTASMFAVPEFMPFGIEFDFASCVAIGLLFAINSIQAIGDFTATTVGGMDRDPSNQELKGGIVAYGLTNALSAFFGGLPTATYSQNVGIVTTNKVVNRTVFGLTGVFLLLAGVSPKFAGHTDYNTPVCTGRSYYNRIFHHCHDRYETYCFPETGRKKYYHSRLERRLGSWYFPGIIITGAVPGRIYHYLWKITRSNRHRYGHTA